MDGRFGVIGVLRKEFEEGFGENIGVIGLGHGVDFALETVSG